MEFDKINECTQNVTYFFKSWFQFFFSAYHFNAWLIIIKRYLTLDLLNSTTEQYKTLKADVMTKVRDVID